MAFLKLLAAGALGYVAYRALQAHRTRQTAVSDTGRRTPPHGDPILVGTRIDVPPTPPAGAQSSRGFGEP
jgi:uncharacterized membrane protein YebE (DUF533 family)